MATSASDLLLVAAETIKDRGMQRDRGEGERSMARAVGMFNEMIGLVPGEEVMTELEGWLFMCCLKMARATAGRMNVDDYIDLAGYAALAAECADRTQERAWNGGVA